MNARFGIAGLFFASLLLLTGCTESIDALCEDAATRQCERCTTCIADLDSSDVSGRQVCGIEKQDDCVAELQNRCEQQSSTLEEPKEDLEMCLDSLNQLTCDEVLRGFAQDTRTTTYECEYFL